MSRSTRSIDYQHVPRPIAVLVDEYEAGFVDPKHSHTRSQLIYATDGVMSVITDQGSFVVPPQRAVWIPGGISHEVHCRTSVALRTLYVESGARAGLPSSCRVIAVPNLLKELILEAADLPIEYDTEGREGRIMELILDELLIIPEVRLHAPMPSSVRLKAVCIRVLNDPARNDVIDDLASEVGCSRRTFTRQFRRETGMSFSNWRQHVRLLEAISRLASGQKITRVAFDVGYNSQSGFTAMFHRVFGTSPSEYISDD